MLGNVTIEAQFQAVKAESIREVEEPWRRERVQAELKRTGQLNKTARPSAASVR